MLCNITPESAKNFAVKWTPRLLVTAFVAYHILGVAYAVGLMAAIDRIAIPIIKAMVGYAGLGATMPVFQWYSALAVQVTGGVFAGIIYDQIEKVFRHCVTALS